MFSKVDFHSHEAVPCAQKMVYVNVCNNVVLQHVLQSGANIAQKETDNGAATYGERRSEVLGKTSELEQRPW
jgi:hypothetical protein